MVLLKHWQNILFDGHWTPGITEHLNGASEQTLGPDLV